MPISTRSSEQTMNPEENAVLEANTRFYQAFESLDIRRMDPIWVKEPYIRCIHPGWSVRSGWQAVRDSWVLIFNHTRGIRFRVTDTQVHLGGELAWVVCIERIETNDGDRWIESQVLATNLYERRDGGWYMILHHGSPVFSSLQETE